MPRGSDHRLRALLRRSWWLLALALPVYLLSVRPFFGITADDAFISFRYAQNWVAGCGPVYNCGETPVEGYTNFLWVAAAAGAMRVGLDLVPTMRLVGLICGFLALTAAVLLGRRIGDRWSCGLVPVVVLGTSPFWAVNTVNGLETAAAALSVLAAALASLGLPQGRRPWLAGAAWGVSYLLRPEGMAFAAITGLWGLVVGLAQRVGPRRLVRSAVVYGLSFMVVVMPHVIWRAAFYSDLVPNSYYAKRFPLDFIIPKNLGNLAGDWPFFLPLLLGALLALLLVKRWSHLYLFLLAMASVAISASVHNNFWMAGHRLYMTAVALLSVVSAGLAELGGDRRRWVGFAAVALLCAALGRGNLMAFPSTYELALQHYARDDTPARDMGRAIRKLARPGDWLVIRDAGTVPFYAGPGVKVLDMHERSLNDRHITRHGWSEEYVMEHHPRFVVFASPFGSFFPPDAPLCQLQGIVFKVGQSGRCMIFAHLQGWLVGRTAQFKAAGYRYLMTARWHKMRHFFLLVRE